MATSTFTRRETLAQSTRTLLYGPVPTGVTAIVFSGTFCNVDSISGADHNITLEVRNVASSYMPRLFKVPIPYGGTSKCPKTVLMPGESLYVTGDISNMMQCMVDVLERI